MSFRNVIVNCHGRSLARPSLRVMVSVGPPSTHVHTRVGPLGRNFFFKMHTHQQLRLM